MVACKAREMLPLDPLHLTPLPPCTHMHTTFFEGEPLGHSPRGTGQVKVLAGGVHGGWAGHPTFGTSPQDGPLPKPTLSASLLLQTVRVARVLSPVGSPAPAPARTFPPGSCASQTRRAASSPAVGAPQASCPRTAFVCPPPSAAASTSLEPWVSASPNPPLSTAAPSCLAPATLPTGASLGLQDRNGQLPRPGAGARWGFCVLRAPGPLSPWVETAG